MTKVTITTREYGTNNELAATPDELTPPFTYTAKDFIGIYQNLPWPNNIQNYYFRLWTIADKYQIDPTLIIDSISGDVTATAWYTLDGHDGAGPTAAYGRAFIPGKEGRFVKNSPFKTVDPPDALYELDTTHRTVLTTNSNVEVTAKDGISLIPTAFVEWFTLQPILTVHRRGESAAVMIEGSLVKVRKNTTVDLIAKYKDTMKMYVAPKWTPEIPDEKTKPGGWPLL